MTDCNTIETVCTVLSYVFHYQCCYCNTPETPCTERAMVARTGFACPVNMTADIHAVMQGDCESLLGLLFYLICPDWSVRSCWAPVIGQLDSRRAPSDWLVGLGGAINWATKVWPDLLPAIKWPDLCVFNASQATRLVIPPTW